MKFIKAEIDDFMIIKPQVFEDSGGYFFKIYNEEAFKKNGISVRFIQDSQSKSIK